MTRATESLSSDRSPTLLFLMQATLIVVGLFGLMRLPWVSENIVGALITFQTTLVTWYGAKPSAGIIVTSSCSGADVAALCLGLTLAYPVRWRRRLIGAAIGATIVLAVNMVRIASLYAVASNPATLNLLHVYVWPAILSLVTVLFAF